MVAWQELVEEFELIPVEHRLELLLEYANALPDLPERLANRPELMERVEECQSPVFLLAEGESDQFRIWLTAPKEAPTTRGFASILLAAMDGLSASEVIAFPKDFPDKLQLSKLVSPLRMAGMQGMLSRIQRKAKEALDSSVD